MELKSLLKQTSFGFMLSGLVLACAPVQAKTFGPLTVQIKNYSTVSMSNLELIVSLNCKTADILAPGSSCGHDSVTLSPNANGIVKIKELNVSTAVFGTNILKVQLISRDRRFNEGVFAQDWSVENHEIERFESKLKTISIYELPTAQAHYTLASGAASADWAKRAGREMTLRYTYTIGQDENKLNAGGSERNSGDAIPATLLIGLGDLGRQPVVTGTVEAFHIQTSSYKALYAKTAAVKLDGHWSPDMIDIAIDDREITEPKRSIDGTYNNVNLNFHENYTGGEHNMYDATITLQCISNQITGQITLKNRPASPRKFQGTLPLRGTCNGGPTGEEASVEFEFQYKTTGGAQKIVIPVERITESIRYKAWLARDPKSFRPSEYSIGLRILDSSAEVLGTAMVSMR